MSRNSNTSVFRGPPETTTSAVTRAASASVVRYGNADGNRLCRSTAYAIAITPAQPRSVTIRIPLAGVNRNQTSLLRSITVTPIRSCAGTASSARSTGSRQCGSSGSGSGRAGRNAVRRRGRGGQSRRDAGPAPREAVDDEALGLRPADQQTLHSKAEPD